MSCNGKYVPRATNKFPTVNRMKRLSLKIFVDTQGPDFLLGGKRFSTVTTETQQPPRDANPMTRTVHANPIAGSILLIAKVNMTPPAREI